MSRLVQTTLLLALALALLVAAPLAADDDTKKSKKKAGKKRDPAAAILRRLAKAELTEEQTAKIKKLAAECAAKNGDIRAKVAAARAEAVKKAKAEGLEGKALRAAVAKTNKDNADAKTLRDAQKKLLQAALSVLTEEQKTKIQVGKKPRTKRRDAKKDEAKKKAADKAAN